MKKKIIKRIIIGIAISLFLALLIPFSILGIRSKKINNDYSYLLKQDRISEVTLDIKLVKQEISCGYAIIEMLTDYYGNCIKEEELYNNNHKKITTATTKGFEKEINKHVDKKIITKQYVKNDKLLLLINESLKNNNPVAVEFAAKLENTWTLHWAIIKGMDKEYIYINNPYGYEEKITYDEFIKRTTFKAFKNMPLGYHFGFAFGLFSKNTIIIAK